MLGFTSAALAAVLLSGSFIGFRLVWLIIFSIFSAAFGFVVNDLSDAELDRSAGINRNPVSSGQLSWGSTVIIAIIFLSISLISLTRLSAQNILLGSIVIFIYLTYSWLIRAKSKPILDVVYHGLCLAVLAAMGFTLYKSISFSSIYFAVIVFLLSSMSQILQEIRDYETDKKMISNTVILLGKRRSLILCLSLFLFTLPFLVLLILNGIISPNMLFLSPLTYFIIAPITRALINENYEVKMLNQIKHRRLILITLLIIALILDKKGEYIYINLSSKLLNLY